MLKRLSAVAVVIFAATVVSASPLHSSDHDYRGAFTLLDAANMSDDHADYSTQIVVSNQSDHSVLIRLELYSTSGYREGMTVNAVGPGGLVSEVYGFWGGKQGNWEYKNAIGENAMGALRVVAVNSDGSEDTKAVIRGYGRLWVEPHSGGRVSEYLPGLTDYEAAGGLRRSHFSSGSLEYAPYIINPVPYAKDKNDVTYGGARLTMTFVNFDREREATFTIPERNDRDFWGNTWHADAIDVTVAPGSSQRVDVPLLAYEGGHTPSIFVNASPLDLQFFMVRQNTGGAQWISYASMIDGTTLQPTLLLDPATTGR